MTVAIQLTESVITAMSTTVSVQVVGAGDARARIQSALAWFPEVERVCSRFLPDSELRQLCTQVGQPVPVSPLLFNALHFALAVAAASDGAFDPTVGATMESRGFATSWRDAQPSSSGVPTTSATWRDIEVDADTHTATLHRPLLLDLGAVAKGLAVDLAAESLADLEHFAIDAGGDLYCAGHNAEGMPWTVGLQHPRAHTECLATLQVLNMAVCTSGDYARRVPPTAPHAPTAHHLWNPRTRSCASTLASATVIAPRAIVADALATAAFILGPVDGLTFLTAQQVEGMLVTPQLACLATAGFDAYRRPTDRYAH
ncbi:MAG: FAD:protein FMN transferase [Gemmatimonadaceae bacterium]